MKRAAIAVPLSLVLALVGLPALTSSPAAAAAPAAGQSTYVPLEPVRVLDTREALGAPAGRVGPGGTLDVRVADGLRVPREATAVVLNVTATGASGPTDVRAYPTPSPTPRAGQAPPEVSNLNLTSGMTVANLVHVAVGPDGSVRLRNEAGQVHLVADLSGYYADGARGSSYVGAVPRRLLDSRADGRPFEVDEVRQLQVAGGASGAPAGATAVVLNVTAVGATRTTDIRVWPTRAGAPPTVSNLNPPPGRPVAAAVVVGVGAGSSVSLRSSAGSVHLIVDLAGWYVPGSPGAVIADAFHPVAPVRVLDTRDAQYGPVRAFGPGEVRTLTVAGAGVVPSPGSAVVLNVTGVSPSATSDLRVYPKGPGAAPEASNLNVVRGLTVANTVVATVGQDGQVSIRNGAGTVHLVVDLAGWFGPAGKGWDISWPQCTARGATTSRLPSGGAFAVIGLTRSGPFTDNECFRAQWEWASSLPGEPAVYVNVNAPGVRDRSAVGNRVWAEVCGTGTATGGCGYRYGQRIAQYALPRLPRTPDGGRPMVWMDVEGPYANGPYWQQERTADPLARPDPAAVAVNRAVIQGVVDVLRAGGFRVGTYSDRGSVADPNNDWRAIVGNWRLTRMQNWVFRSPDAEPHTICGPEHSFSGGPVVMAQVQPATNPGVDYDVNGLC